jgi:hypothetical protein
MIAYYVWPVLAVGLLVAALGSTRRFGAAIAVAVVTTVVLQWGLGQWPWWVLSVGAVTVLLVVSSRPEPLPEVAASGERHPPPKAGATRRRGPAVSQQKKKKQARTNRKSARR